jgi:outer membrane protease
MAVKKYFLGAGAAVLLMAAPVLAGTAVQPPPTSITIQPVQQLQGEPEFWLHAGVESWSGDNTYQIGFPVTDALGNRYEGYFPFSELKFPLDVVFGVLKFDAVVRDKWVINAQLKKDLSDPDDYLEDRDWLTESNPNRLDVYSDSEVTEFEGYVFDVDLGYKFFCRDRGWVAAGAGYMYQNFEYETSVIRQWSPSGLPGFDFVGDGMTTSIYYEVDYKIPYLFLGGEALLAPKFKLKGRFAYAPWVSSDNRDQHRLRYKENRSGDLDGDAFMFSADAQYDFAKHWFVTAGFSYTSIDVDGDMDATFFGVYDHTVREELESEQTALFFTVGYRLGPEPPPAAAQ